MATFLLIRHGLTDAVNQRLTGHAAGVHLNEAGRRQVLRLAARLQSAPLTAVASSPLERARETAAPIAQAHGLQVQVVPDLIEYDTGAWTGLSLAELDRDPEWRRFNEVRSLARTPGGESMLDIQKRAVAALLDLDGRFKDAVVAVVSHGDVIRAALLYFLGMPIDFIHRIKIDPARVSVVVITPGGPVVQAMNADNVDEVV